MKKTTLLLVIILTAFVTNVYAQADSTGVLNKKHELKIGAVKLLAGAIVEVTYEYIHSETFTYGVSVLGT